MARQGDTTVTVTGIAPYGVVGLSGRAGGEELRRALGELLEVGVREMTVDLHQATCIGAETIGVLMIPDELFP